MVTNHVATISRDSFTSVEIEIEKIEHTVDNQLSEINVSNSGQEDTRTLLVDLARVKEAVTVNGFLLDQSTSSAQTKKQNLLSMLRNSSTQRGNMAITWGDSPFSEATGNKLKGNVSKFSISESPGRLTDSAENLGTDTRTFSIILTIFRGDHIG